MISNEPASARPAGLIVREDQPLNLESPFDLLDDLLTPNHLFYVRNHFPIPELDARAHQLSVTGAVKCPFTISYEDLLKMQPEIRTATLECAGNSGFFLSPPVEGVQWHSGAVGTAEWTGVPLSALLDRAGVNHDACEIVFEGADRGVPKEKPAPPREIHYARSIPLSKARETLVAHAMNGQALSPEHGYPLRALVPGHYGMASVKWLSAIHVVTTPFQGYFQTTDYAYWNEIDTGNPERVPLGEMYLKSQIVRPQLDAIISADSCYKVTGAAWSAGQVDTVEFSDDGGQTWREAQFLDPALPGVWRRWQFNWQVPSTPGLRTLQSRALDAQGNIQPERHDNRFGTYVIHHVLPVRVMISS